MNSGFCAVATGIRPNWQLAEEMLEFTVCGHLLFILSRASHF
jgi:hypothetical protein